MKKPNNLLPSCDDSWHQLRNSVSKFVRHKGRKSNQINKQIKYRRTKRATKMSFCMLPRAITETSRLRGANDLNQGERIGPVRAKAHIYVVFSIQIVF